MFSLIVLTFEQERLTKILEVDFSEITWTLVERREYAAFQPEPQAEISKS
jgi:hypothetical protein